MKFTEMPYEEMLEYVKNAEENIEKDFKFCELHNYVVAKSKEVCENLNLSESDRLKFTIVFLCEVICDYQDKLYTR